MPAVGDLVRGHPEEVAEMLRRFVAVAEAGGHVELEVLDKMVVLHGARRIFASARPTAASLRGHLNLLRQVHDPRFTKIEPLTKRIWYHRYLLKHPHQLDDAFIGWIGEAWDVGQGAASR
jgi:Domain of unknown function (DUF5655)